MAVPIDSLEVSESGSRRQWWPGYLIVAGLIVLGIIGGQLLGGQLGQFMVSGLQTIPFAVLALFAYLGIDRDWARVLALLWLFVLLLGIGGVGVMAVFAALLARAGLLPQLTSTAPLTQAQPLDSAAIAAAIFSPAMGVGILSVLVSLVAAGLMFVPSIRRAIARVLPIDPSSFVHMIALAIVVGGTLISLGQLVATGGSPAMLEVVKASPDVAEAAAASDQLLMIVYAFVWTFPGAVIAGGFPVVRSFGGALRRLGLVRPTVRQVAGALGIACLMVVGATLLDNAISSIWGAMGWPRTDSETFEQLLGAAISPIGAVLIGVTAGVGEEMTVRGALQPRLGILLSNLFFASLHAFQYGFDALLSVFIIGLVLGVLRKRTNTTTSAIAHGTYDFILVMIAALGLFQ
jgi:uncharacterized protein